MNFKLTDTDRDALRKFQRNVSDRSAYVKVTITGKVRILPPPPIKPKLTPINIEALKPTISVEVILFCSDFVNNTTKVSGVSQVFRDNYHIATKFYDFVTTQIDFW